MEGRKRWRLYDALVEQPRPDMKVKPRATELGQPFVDFVLEAGDLLYLPSGLIHEARTLGAEDDDEDQAAGGSGSGSASPPSLHMTLGVESTVFGSWELLLLELVAAGAADTITAADERGGGGDAAAPEQQQEAEDEVLGLPCGADASGPTLRQVLSAPIDPAAAASSSSLRWGDLLVLGIVHLAGRERRLRQAVPLAPLLVEGAGGQAAVLRGLGELGALVREGTDVGAAVRAFGVDEGAQLLLKLPRSLGGEGSAGRRAQQRIEAAGASVVLGMLKRPEVVDGLGNVLRQLECTLRAHAAPVMRRFSAVAARDQEARRRVRREALEQLAWQVSVASVEAGMAGQPQVFAVGGPGRGGDGEL